MLWNNLFEVLVHAMNLFLSNLIERLMWGNYNFSFMKHFFKKTTNHTKDNLYMARKVFKKYMSLNFKFFLRKYKISEY